MMKFCIDKSTFVNGLQQVLSIIEQRAVIPILSNVLLECEHDVLKLTATNMDLTIKCAIKAEIAQPGSITLPAKKLSAIIRSLPGTMVDIEQEGTRVKISCGRSHFQIMGLDASEFPDVTSPSLSHKTTLSQETVAKMLKWVSFAQSTDNNRFILNSVNFCFEEGKLTLAATDGRRLSVISQEIPGLEALAKGMVVPSKTVREIERLLGHGRSFSFEFDNKQALFTFEVDPENKEGLTGDMVLISKVIEGNYPNFRQIIPKTTENRVKLDRQLTLECIQRVAIVTGEQKNLVQLKFADHTLEVSASSTEYGEAHEKLAIVYDGAPVTIAFNYLYICDPLKVLTQDEVFFEFKDELSAGVFKTLDNFIYVVMPLRMN